MKRIGVILAVQEELDALLGLLKLEKKKTIYDLTFYECSYDNQEIILVKSGVGKVNAARCCQILIDSMSVNTIFNIGVAGAVNKDISVGDLVIGERLVQHDFDLTAFQHEKGYIPKIGVYISGDPSLLSLTNSLSSSIPVHKGVIASGDIFCTNEEMGKSLSKEFHALCVEMEGASIAQVCYLSNIPFLVIRSISDSIYQKDNKVTYEEFLNDSSKKVANYLLKLLEKMK